MLIRTIILTIFCCFAWPLAGQVNWIEPGAQWHYNYTGAFGTDTEGYEIMSYEGDRTLGNQSFKILKRERYLLTYYLGDTLTWDSSYYELPERIWVYQRGDTIWQFKNGKHFELYNMSLGIGDTATFMQYGGEYYGLIEDTFSIMHNGLKLRTQTIGTYRDTAKWVTVQVIEKMGLIGGGYAFFWDEQFPFLVDGPSWRLECYSENQLSWMRTGIDSCEVWPPLSNSLIEGEDFFINAYPNPVTDRLRISSNLRISRIALFQMTGQKVFESRSFRAGDEIDFSAYTKGMYLIKVYTKDQAYVLKVIK